MASQEGRPPKVLSCLSCRSRKVRCDKTQPICNQCDRYGHECAYPSRKPTRRAPRPRQSELLDRISRLESIVVQADPEKLRQLDAGKQGNTPGSVDEAASASAAKTTPSSGSTSSANPPIDPAARYLSGEFWGNLCDEVEGIKQVLDQPSDDDDGDDDDDDEDTPESQDTTSGPSAGSSSGFIFGNPGYHERISLVHPPPDMRFRLWDIYNTNVDPLMKFLHRPTIEKQMRAFAESPNTHPLDAPATALFFCIYFAAVTSLRPELCQALLGQPHEALANKYRLHAERALAAADYLNATDLVTLQAFAIYVTILRAHCHSRSSWALTALLIRLAQAMNLHRDGDGSRFSPYVAELRRRLWHYIIVMDVRGAEDRGTDAILSRSSHNTAVPTPIDDADFSPSSTGPLVPKVGIPDNVISICMAMCSGVFGLMMHPQEQVTDGPGRMYTEDELVTAVRRLENDFIHGVDPDNLPSVYASEIARMVSLKLWLIIQFPFTAQSNIARQRPSRGTMLQTAVSIMEISERMSDPPLGNRFGWWTALYLQWHPLAVALAELCVQTEGELVEHAWALIDHIFPLWRERVADNASGALWRPIRKLLKKAKAARAASLMKGLTLTEPAQWPASTTPDPTLLAQTQPGLTQGLSPGLPVTPSAQPYDSINMDPSYLFEYPRELLDVNFDMLGTDTPFDMAPWNEFLIDAQMNDSPEGSGGNDSM